MIARFTSQKIAFLCSLLSIAILCTSCSTQTEMPPETIEDASITATTEASAESIEDSATSVSEVQLQDFTTVDFAALDIQQSIQTILERDDYYPNITDIVASEDYREFTILLNGSTISTYESMLIMSFYTVGDAYQKAQGVPDEQVNTIVRYQDTTTGEIISETGSNSH